MAGGADARHAHARIARSLATQIEDGGEIEPAFIRPNIADTAHPLPVGRIGQEIAPLADMASRLAAP